MTHWTLYVILLYHGQAQIPIEVEAFTSLKKCNAAIEARVNDRKLWDSEEALNNTFPDAKISTKFFCQREEGSKP